MRTLHKEVKVDSIGGIFNFYVIGDIHLGAFNCAESHLRRFVKYIKSQDNALWFGGGDYCNCISPADINRYDVRALADWIFAGSATNIKEALLDISKQERERFCDIVAPIKDKCIGLLEGNHEQKLMQRMHNGHHYLVCETLGVPNLMDASFVRLCFKQTRKNGGSAVVVVWIVHGCGGGRTPGAEPNHLARLSQTVEADIVLRGHSHTFRIEPPEPRLFIPRRGVLPDECLEKYVYKANWGCWLKSYAAGPSTYDSRANYPARPLITFEIKIKPFSSYNKKSNGRANSTHTPHIQINECPYSVVG